MPQQDYVRRAKPKAKKKRTNSGGARRGGKPQPQSASSGKVMWLVLGLLVVAAFGYAIWKLSQSKPEQAASQQPVKQAPVEVDDDPLPPKPKEQWSYIEELENKEVVVEVPKQEAPTRPYQMQCGSFRSMPQADELKAKIAFQGLESDVRRTEGKNGVWYRVVLGPYERKRLAERDRHKLSNAAIYGCKIWYWN